MRGVDVAIAVGADQQKPFDLFLPLSTMSTNPRGVRPAHCKSSITNTSGLCREATPRKTSHRVALGTHLGRHRVACVRGDRSRAANSGVTAAAMPALGPSPRRMRSRSAATSSSGSANSTSSQRAKRLMHAVKFQVTTVLIELAGHEPAVAGRHDRPQLIDQRGLAHPGSATDEHSGAPA